MPYILSSSFGDVKFVVLYLLYFIDLFCQNTRHKVSEFYVLKFKQKVISIPTLFQHWSFLSVCLLICDDHDTTQNFSGKNRWKET